MSETKTLSNKDMETVEEPTTMEQKLLDKVEKHSAMLEKIFVAIIVVAVLYWISTSPFMNVFSFWMLFAIGFVLVSVHKVSALNRKENAHWWISALYLVAFAIGAYFITSYSVDTAWYAALFLVVVSIADIAYTVYEHYRGHRMINKASIGANVIGNLLVIISLIYGLL